MNHNFDVEVNKVCLHASRQSTQIFMEKEKTCHFNKFTMPNFTYCLVMWNFCGIVQIRKM